MGQFAHFDTKLADGVYVRFEKKIEPDAYATPDDFDCYDEAQKEAWKRDEWGFYGIRAVAEVSVVRSGHGTYYRLESAGLWGVEWSGDPTDAYVEDVFQEQKTELLNDLRAFGDVKEKA